MKALQKVENRRTLFVEIDFPERETACRIVPVSGMSLRYFAER
jgi:hypothetical protein